MKTMPVVLIKSPHWLAALLTAAIHAGLFFVLFVLAFESHEWRQISINQPTIEVSLITQRAASPTPVPITPNKTISETAAKRAPVSPHPKRTEKPAKQPVLQQTTEPTSNISSITETSTSEEQTRKAETAAASVASSNIASEATVAMSRKAEPDYAYNPPPEYPKLLRDNNITGTVIIKVQVQANGLPQTVLIQQSSGYQLMDNAAVKAVQKWKFIPAIENNQPTTGWVEFPVHFLLHGK